MPQKIFYIISQIVFIVSKQLCEIFKRKLTFVFLFQLKKKYIYILCVILASSIAKITVN